MYPPKVAIISLGVNYNIDVAKKMVSKHDLLLISCNDVFSWGVPHLCWFTLWILTGYLEWTGSTLISGHSVSGTVAGPAAAGGAGGAAGAGSTLLGGS